MSLKGRGNNPCRIILPEKEHTSYRDRSSEVVQADEQKTIEAFIAGDSMAFKYVYNKYRERIYSYCLYVTGSRILADDAFQEVFIRVYQRHNQLREVKALKNWLLMIARSVCLNLVRESVFTPEFIYLDDEIHRHEGHSGRKELSFEGIDQQFSEEIFQLAFNRIAPIYRDAFLLREIEGFTSEEVAELTGTTAANVKVRILRAKKMLREILAPHFSRRLDSMEKQNPAATTDAKELKDVNPKKKIFVTS